MWVCVGERDRVAGVKRRGRGKDVGESTGWGVLVSFA